MIAGFSVWAKVLQNLNNLKLFVQVTKSENFAAPAEPAAPKVLEISSSHQFNI